MLGDRTFSGLNLAVFLMMVGVGMIVALLPQRLIAITGSGSSVGYLASAFAISYIALQVPIGSLSDRIGFKAFIMAGYVVCFLTGMLYYASGRAGLLFLGRLLQGAGEAPVWALAPALLSIRYPHSRGKVMGFYNATIHVGLSVGPIVGVLVAERWPGNQAFLLYALLCLAGAVVILLTVSGSHPVGGQDKAAMSLCSIRKLMANKQVLIALLGITLYGAGYGIFLTVIPAFLITGKGFSSAGIGAFFALFYFAISLSQIATGPLSDRMGRVVFMVVGLAVSFVGILAFPPLLQPWITLVLAVASLGLGVFYLASMAFLNETVPDVLKGTISGAYYLFWGIGMFLGPVLVSKVSEYGGSYGGFYLFAFTLAAVAAAMLVNGRGNIRRSSHP